MPSLVSALERRVRAGGATPLLTYYDLTGGERTELSAKTFANWADKCAHLLLEHEVEPGDLVGVPLLATRPGHWLALAATMATWQVGAVATPIEAPAARVLITGPEGAVAEPGVAVLASSLHPLGLPLPAESPWADFNEGVRMQPDAHYAATVPDSWPAWVDAQHELTVAELADLGGTAKRRVVRPTGPWQAVREALISPVLGGGSSVIVVGEASEARLAELAKAELALLD